MGTMKWLPESVIDEIQDIKREKRINKDSDALRKMVEYTRTGREVERLIKLDFSKAKKRKPLKSFYNKQKRIKF